MAYKTITQALLIAGLAVAASSAAFAADKPKLMMGANAMVATGPATARRHPPLPGCRRITSSK